MAIKIKTLPPEQSAHDEAAAAIETTVATTTTKSGQADPIDQTVEHSSEPLNTGGVPFERIEVGMSFKMPVASYTMLEFSIRRSVPFPVGEDPDAVFEATHKWVEDKLNLLIEKQQTEQAAG